MILSRSFSIYHLPFSFYNTFLKTLFSGLKIDLNGPISHILKSFLWKQAPVSKAYIFQGIEGT